MSTSAELHANRGAHRLQTLERAFTEFNETSRQLQASWSGLQDRVAELTRERDAAQQARMQELAARESVAERLQALLEALPGAVVMTDGDGRVRECNAGARELLGQPLLGANWRDVAARGLQARSDSDGTPCLADGRRLGVSRRATTDGGCVLLLTDESEAFARRSGMQLQQQLSSIDENNARLAHQLRTPLASAVLYVSRITDGDLDSDDCRRMAGKALARLRDLQQLIDQTLAFARGDSTQAQAFAVSDLLRDARRSAAAHSRDSASIDIHDTRDDIHLRGQRSLLVSALVNLIDNGLAFSRSVRVHADRECDGVVLVVEDDGPGVDGSVAARIFEPFFTTRTDGTGLGLAMARTVARAHGGDITLAPTPRGARFELRLPFAGAGRPLPSDLDSVRDAMDASPDTKTGTLR